MKYHHELLWGEDMLQGLEIESAYLHLRCEQELKNLLFRLQTGCLGSYRRARRLKSLFHQAFQSFLKKLHAVKVLFEKPFDQERSELIPQIASQLEIDPQTLSRLVEIDRQASSAQTEFLRAAVTSLIEVVAQAGASVDRIPNQVELVEVEEG